MKRLEIEAKIEHMDQVFSFLNEALEGYECPRKSLIQIRTSVEEVFVNVASYAYGSEVGNVTILCDVAGDPPCLSMTFLDSGTPYNPLENADPNLDTPAEERQIGGLGIFMVKQYMDEVSYSFRDGQNVLTMRKKLGIAR